jgi:acyl transferase domain-containing protein
VYARAGIDPADTGFVEAHGTGTKVGDPVEATAIYNVFGKGRTLRQPLYIGSVKSNVGHLEGASGVISVIKSSLMLEKGFILPNANFERPNAEIPMAEWNLKVSMSSCTPRCGRFLSSIALVGKKADTVFDRIGADEPEAVGREKEVH